MKKMGSFVCFSCSLTELRFLNCLKKCIFFFFFFFQFCADLSQKSLQSILVCQNNLILCKSHKYGQSIILFQKADTRQITKNLYYILYPQESQKRVSAHGLIISRTGIACKKIFGNTCYSTYRRRIVKKAKIF